ncbi:hypothetical protein OQA88_1061 [Cercophora sp. LCS_1]
MAAPSGPQAATFRYFHFNPEVHSREKPYEILMNLPLGGKDPNYRRHNKEFEERRVPIQDARGREDKFTLDKNSFCWRHWEGPETWRGIDAEGVKALGNEEVETTYIKEVESFIASRLEQQDGEAVDIVKVFDYRLRASMNQDAFDQRTLDLDNGLDPMRPVSFPHVGQSDQSFIGAIKRVHEHMGDQAHDLLKRRWRVVNVWKPLKAVTNWPLALCNTVSVHQDDLVASDLIRRRTVGESWYCKYNPAHAWYYLSNQEPHEVTMLKIQDSKDDEPFASILHFNWKGNILEKAGRALK